MEDEKLIKKMIVLFIYHYLHQHKRLFEYGKKNCGSFCDCSFE